MPTVLVTGGAGFIGSHTCVELLGAGYEVIVIDNFSNSSPKALDAVQALAGRAPIVVVGDAADREVLDQIFAQHRIDSVIHFAAFKAVGESVAEPLRYYQNNLGSTIALLGAMQAAGCGRLVFSSSCTVYGDPDQVPIVETSPLRAVNPYGRTKLASEDIMRDLAASDPTWRIILLRYFNPVGAHPSGQLGEDPRGVPNNIMPFLMQVAVGRRDCLSVFGGDYPTRDGTCVRDYIHVVDLARGHLAALDVIDELAAGCLALNLGTGTGTTVLELIKAAEEAIGRPVNHQVVPRRPGDAVEVYADPAVANALLRWKTTHDVHDMCRDHWNWQSLHPFGFGSAD